MLGTGRKSSPPPATYIGEDQLLLPQPDQPE
jgi:hypothetical protein